ncbi:hypothetical protein F4775DRAFT_591229 [Biscogniauxia sp. FL1348]|nr:hypothetical protein F4775DRAFT_591229 [Biscogniauxia sp. FL1348]
MAIPNYNHRTKGTGASLRPLRHWLHRTLPGFQHFPGHYCLRGIPNWQEDGGGVADDELTLHLDTGPGVPFCEGIYSTLSLRSAGEEEDGEEDGQDEGDDALGSQFLTPLLRAPRATWRHNPERGHAFIHNSCCSRQPNLARLGGVLPHQYAPVTIIIQHLLSRRIIPSSYRSIRGGRLVPSKPTHEGTCRGPGAERVCPVRPPLGLYLHNALPLSPGGQMGRVGEEEVSHRDLRALRRSRSERAPLHPVDVLVIPGVPLGGSSSEGSIGGGGGATSMPPPEAPWRPCS